jgi:hypothetical protein
VKGGTVPQVTLPVNDWSPGVYYLNVSAAGKTYAEKFMKL